jgi:hypothetical protein
MPIELKPAATNRPRTSGDSPSRYRSSGVNDSGPLKNTRMPAFASTGIRSVAASSRGSMWSRSGGRVPNANPSGTPPAPHGLATGSNQPTSSLPASSLK